MGDSTKKSASVFRTVVPIPEEYHDLFEKPTFAHVGTLTADGALHITPVWIDYDPEAERLLVNTECGRQKERNARANPAIGVSMTDPDDPYRYPSVVCEVEELRTEALEPTSTIFRGGTWTPSIRTRAKLSEW